MEIFIHDLIGKPFQTGGRGPDGYDCWGLCREIYHRLGIELPDHLVDSLSIDECNGVYQAELKHLVRLEKPEIYAMIAMRFNATVINHCGVYLGNKQFIHIRQKANVCIESIENAYWKRAINAYYKWSG